MLGRQCLLKARAGGTEPARSVLGGFTGSHTTVLNLHERCKGDWWPSIASTAALQHQVKCQHGSRISQGRAGAHEKIDNYHGDPASRWHGRVSTNCASDSFFQVLEKVKELSNREAPVSARPGQVVCLGFECISCSAG